MIKGKRFVTFNPYLALVLALASCQSIPPGSVVEKSKTSRPGWTDSIGTFTESNKRICVIKYQSKEDLPKSIRKAQIQAKSECDKKMASAYIESRKRLSYRYSEKDLVARLESCTKKCSKISDMYYEKVAETNNLYSYDIYVKMSYPLEFKISQ